MSHYCTLFILTLVSLLSACSPLGSSGGSQSQIPSDQITKQNQVSLTLTDDIRPLARQHQSNTSANPSTPEIAYVNAQASMQIYSCNPLNIVTNDPYFRCDMGSQTQTILQHHKLKERVFQIYEYRLLMTDDPSSLVLSHTGNIGFEVLSKHSYRNQADRIIWDQIQQGDDIIILTQKDLLRGGSYVPADQVIRIHIDGNQVLYHSMITSGHYLKQDYRTTRTIAPDETMPYKLAPHGQIIFQGYHRPQAPQIKRDMVLASGMQTDIQVNASGVIISYQGLQEDTSYTIKGSVEDKVFVYHFETFGPFKVTVSKNIAKHPLRGDKYQADNDQYDNNYHLCFNQPLDESSVRSSLDQSIGSGNYSMVLSMQESVYRPWLSMTGETRQDYCVMLYYYIDPSRAHTFSLKGVRSIFGDHIDHIDITIPAHSLSKQHRYATIVGNMLNFLPSQGTSYQSIQYNYKNISGMKLTYQTCHWIGNQEMSQNIRTHQNNDTETELIEQMISCDPVQSTGLIFSGFQRWKNGLGTIELKKIFSGTIPSIFKIGLGEHASKYFISSNIGVIAKYAPGVLHLRTTDTYHGKALSGVEVEIGYLSGPNDMTSMDQARFVSVTGKVDVYGSFAIPKLGYINQVGYIKASYSGDQTLVLYPDMYMGWTISGGQQYVNYRNNFVIDAYQIGALYGYTENIWKLYAYTDRALYKAGDEVYIAGRIRKPHSSMMYTGDLTISIIAPDGTTLISQNLSGVDDFGGFKSSYTLGDKPAFGMYRIDYYTPVGSYTSYFMIQEYKKSNYYIQTNPLITNQGQQYMRLEPRYYRGAPVTSYHASIQYSLKTQHDGIYDQNSESDQPWYYARVWGENQISQGSSILTGQTGMIDLPLTQVQFPASIYISSIITDLSNQEVVSYNINHQLYPKYLVGMQGWEYDWIASQDKYYTIQGKVLDFVKEQGDILDNYQASQNSQIQLITYYKAFNNLQEQGPDQERYYADEPYVKIAEQTVDVANGLRNHQVDINKAGKYFVRAIYDSGYETQKTIVSYGGDEVVYGDPNNNFKLAMFVKDKTYQIGDPVEVQIEPYIKGSTVIVTVEKDGNILEQRQEVLDGAAITLKTKADRYPNARVSVVQLVGQDLNSQISKRKEPRFMIGYSTIKLDPEAMLLKYRIQVSDMQGKVLDSYKPGQKVKVSIDVTDQNNQATQARLSVGIVDKGLIDLYDQIKKPLESFYLQSVPGFAIISNLKLIYQSLKVFSSDGSKGGGGDGDGQGPLSLPKPRTKFRDIAYWRGALITDQAGHIEFETTLPDNLTTRIVEVIGVSKDGKMSADRSYFRVSKDVVLTTNLPQFIGYQDVIKVNLALTSNKTHIDAIKVQGSASLGTHKIALPIHKVGSGSYQTTLDMTQFPLQDIIDQDVLKLFLEAGESEQIIQEIPLRKEGLTTSYHQARYAKHIDQYTSLSGGIKQGTLKVNISHLPLQATENAINYLIHYPYGCLEQTISGLYPLLLAYQLDQKNILKHKYFSGNQVLIGGQTATLDQLIQDALVNIDTYYNPDQALYAFWPGNEGNYELSAYVYHVILLAKSLGYRVDTANMAKLEQKLNQQKNPYLRLYYLRSKGQNTSIDTQTLKEYLKSDSNPVFKIFVYAISAYQGKNEFKLVADIEKFLASTQTAEIAGSYTPFIDKDILKTIYVRGLLKNQETDKVKPYILEFHRSADHNGVRGFSTQKNMQILAMMTDYILVLGNIQKQDTQVSVKLQDQSYDILLTSGKQSQTLTLDIQNSTGTHLLISGSQDLMVTYQLDYIPQDQSLLTNQMHGVKYLNLNYSGTQNVDIGQIVHAQAQWYVNQKAHQVAIVYPIPSNFKIINPLLGQQEHTRQNMLYDAYQDEGAKGTDTLSFTNIGTSRSRYTCQPDHYEIRFDQLFLYYDQIQESAGCQIEFDMIKTHEGKSDQQALKLWEMYLGNVRANKR